MEESNVSNSAKFKVAIIGSSQIRVAKVVSLINDDFRTLPKISSITMESTPSSVVNKSNVDDIDKTQENEILRGSVEYIPCVATFDSYEDETDGKSIRYLSKVEYHGISATRLRGSSLAPFFDENCGGSDDTNKGDCHDEESDKKTKRIPGIAAVAIGCGIETKEEVAMIMTFIRSMSVHKEVVLRPSTTTAAQLITAEKASSSLENGIDNNFTLVQCIQPNVEYGSMEDENQVYKQMSREEKQIVTLNRTMGPGKMAKFAQSLAYDIGTMSPPPCSQAQDSNNDEGAENMHISKESQIRPQQSIPKIKNTAEQKNKTQFACKQCRTILFNENDLEDPPHKKAQHAFNRTKINLSSSCNSVFLAEGLEWMGDISTSMEGKLCCPKCTAKLGLWKWAGTQCSCGTWVTPAIQIRLSRIDVISANDCCRGNTSGSGSVLPLGTVMPSYIQGR